MNHDEYLGKRFDKGKAYENFIYRVAAERGNPLHPYLTWEGQKIGENREGIEIKYASKLKRYQSAWIEVAEKTYPEDSAWRKAGILREDNTRFFCTGDYNEIWIFPIYDILGAYNTGPYKITVIEKGTSRGFRLFIKDFKKWNGKRLDLMPYRYLMLDKDRALEDEAKT